MPKNTGFEFATKLIVYDIVDGNFVYSMCDIVNGAFTFTPIP